MQVHFNNCMGSQTESQFCAVYAPRCIDMTSNGKFLTRTLAVDNSNASPIQTLGWSKIEMIKESWCFEPQT